MKSQDECKRLENENYLLLLASSPNLVANLNWLYFGLNGGTLSFLYSQKINKLKQIKMESEDERRKQKLD